MYEVLTLLSRPTTGRERDVDVYVQVGQHDRPRMIGCQMQCNVMFTVTHLQPHVAREAMLPSV